MKVLLCGMTEDYRINRTNGHSLNVIFGLIVKYKERIKNKRMKISGLFF